MNTTNPRLGLARAFFGIVAMAAMTCLSPAAFAAAGGGGGGGGNGGGAQASLTLQNCDAKYCYTHNNLWTLSKEITENTIADGAGKVTWTVTATKSDGGTTFSVHGGLTILNSGTADATIGNIVVNLQKPNSPKKGSNASHVSIAANVANSTIGDAATSALIVASGSQENVATNAAWGTNNYSVSGATGTFVETPGKSGTLTFTDAFSNDAFAIHPDFVLAPGASVTLLYHATFDPSVLDGLAPGTALRVETLVSFGNVNPRGGSGAAGTNIDVDGSGVVDKDEANVRTVPCRVSMAGIPAAPEECNVSVSVLDAGPSTTGTVTTSNLVGFDAFPATITDTASWTVSADVSGGAEGGTVCNGASLEGDPCGGTLNLIIGYTPDEFADISPNDGIDNPVNIGHQPIYATFECAPAPEGSDSDCAVVGTPEDTTVVDGDFCTFSQGGFGGSGHPYDTLAANFATLYPSGVEIGIPGAGGYSMTFTSAAAVQAFLPAGGGASKLIADLVDPTSSAAGVFGGQLLALKLNIALSDAAIKPTGFGDLVYCDATSSLNGKTVRQILAAAEIAIGGGALPSGYSYSTLSGLCANLDLSFDGKDATYINCGVASDWAVQFLKVGGCPP